MLKFTRRKKVKFPCKICSGRVTKKTGIQCQGPCKNWMHYSCLNYTRGRIMDIKAGVIKVICPCPDCKTNQLKEYRIDRPFSCSNLKCPAKIPPKCVDTIFSKDKEQFRSEKCPLTKCNCSCRKASPTSKTRKELVPKGIQISRSNISFDLSQCSGCCSNVGGDGNSTKYSPLNAMEKVCKTMGLLTKQINNLMECIRLDTEDRCCSKRCRCRCQKPCYCDNNPINR